MYFPVAGIEVSVWVPPLVAFAVSFCTSMGGVSGAFLLLPFQMSVLGYVSPSVSATNQVFNIVAIPSGVYRYIREKRMVWPLTYATALGTLPGVFLGAYIRVKYLPDPKNFKMFAAAVLGYIGLRLVRDTFFKKAPAKPAPGSGPGCSMRDAAKPVSCAQKNALQSSVAMGGTACGPQGNLIDSMAVSESKYSFKQVEFVFQGERYCFSTGGVLLMSLIVGVVGGVYGIGGGAIIAPFFVAFFGLPVYTVAGAALMGTFLTSVSGVVFYQAIAPFWPELAVAPDWTLGALFGLGGFAGMYVGARCQKYVPAKYIKAFLSACILFLAARYVYEFLK
ncbi:sulfite exporter TauE/SafE family protein [Fundidesulfovibrio soli]|uniref:sulfite exporter TauE/SafE family protein n=1 Tax=Fundidesulfovibrio soli TaxID=2922716 RepID=UPI001FAF779B|nr:sulfite exporter TauE/SafE family protein [Fundidesulfovibrio soli]